MYVPELPLLHTSRGTEPREMLLVLLSFSSRREPRARSTDTDTFSTRLEGEIPSPVLKENLLSKTDQTSSCPHCQKSRICWSHLNPKAALLLMFSFAGLTPLCPRSSGTLGEAIGKVCCKAQACPGPVCPQVTLSMAPLGREAALLR